MKVTFEARREMSDFETITLQQVIALLAGHGIDGIFDDNTGSCLADDLGQHDTYNRTAIIQWLGY